MECKADPHGLVLACLALAAASAITLGPVGALAADDPAAAAPGHTLYGDPVVPDISGLWYGSYEAAPGEVPQTPVEPRNLAHWAPWPPPLTPAYQKLSDDRAAAAKAGRAIGDLGAQCLPFGAPRALTGRSYPDEVIQTPGVVSVLPFGTFPLIIWTDGRPHPKDLKPSYNGHSIGYWQGDTLYVDTVGILAGVMVDSARRIVHSDKLHMKTTIQRVGPDVLHVHVVLYDPEAFTEPMVTTNIWRRKSGPQWQLYDDISCWENNRNQVDDTGATGFTTF